MRIGILLPSILTSHTYGEGRIFAPLIPAVALANGLVKKGHAVFFYTSADVQTDATVIGGNEELTNNSITYYQMREREEIEKQYRLREIIYADFENALTMRAYKDAKEGKLDVIHSYHDFSAHYFEEVTKVPTVYTLHNPLPQESNTIEYERFKQFAHHNFISISNAQRKSILPLHFAATIYHGTDLSSSTFSEAGGEDLLFMGRMVFDKGADVALALAKTLGRQLHIATAPAGANRNHGYYAEKIQPYLDEGVGVVQGFFHGNDKNTFLGNGKLLLAPIQWEEPFGLVLTDAMSCGTPVVAYARGSAPELIVDGVNGYLVNASDDDIRGNFIVKKTGIEGLQEAVERVYALSHEEYRAMRNACRQRVEKEFSVEKMVNAHEALYKKVLEK